MYSAWGGWKAWEEEGFDLLCLRLDLNTRVAEFQLACAVVLTWRMIYSKVWACLTTLTQRYVTLHQKPFFFPLLYKPYISPHQFGRSQCFAPCSSLHSALCECTCRFCPRRFYIGMLGGWAVASGVKGDGFHGGVGMGKKKRHRAER